MFNRPLKSVVVAALIAAMPGCTAAVWRPACEDRAVQPQLAGIVRNYPRPGDRAVVVRYKAIGDGTDVDLVVPLSADLRPTGPFAPPGDLSVVRFGDDHNSVETIAGGVSLEQIADVQAQFTRIQRDRRELGRHLNAKDYSPVASELPKRTGTDPVHPDTVSLIAFEFNAAGEVVPLVIDRDKSSDRPIHLAATDRLMLVPTTVPRPPGDQGRDEAVAVALTPVTVPADIAGAGVAVGCAGAILGVAAAFVIVVSPLLIYNALNPSGENDNDETKTTSPPAKEPPQGPATVQIPIIIDGPAAIQP
jgi:hypothetical protein